MVGGGYEELIQWGNGVPLYRAFGTLGGEFRLFQHVLLKIGYEFVYTTPHGLSKNEKKKIVIGVEQGEEIVPWYRTKTQKQKKSN